MTYLLTRVSYLNFLAGLLAAVGTGYLTAIPFSAEERDSMIGPLLTAAVMWIVSSALLATVAHQYVIMLDSASSKNLAAFSTPEQAELVKVIVGERRTPTRILWALFLLALLISFATSAAVLYWPEVLACLEAGLGVTTTPESSPSLGSRSAS